VPESCERSSRLPTALRAVGGVTTAEIVRADDGQPSLNRAIAAAMAYGPATGLQRRDLLAAPTDQPTAARAWRARDPGVITDLEGGRPGATLLLRADMDALPLQR